MPKKDVNSAVLGMLSAAGSQTRPPVLVPEDPPGSTPPDTGEGHRPLTPVPTAAAEAADSAPRTLRLRPGAASRLRQAWLEAKRDDVLLTAQDFASDLVEEALARRRRRAATSS